ncbi:response regulator [Lachnospiraceae bacterium 54-53]
MYRLMIADDERIVLKGIRNTIDWASLDAEVVATAENGEEFYKKALECMPDIALVDIRMPVMDGLEAIERLRPVLQDCQFIIFTAYEDFSYAKRALELGVMAYITKPVLKNEVIEKVRLAAERLEARGNGKRSKARQPVSAIDQIKRYMQSHVDSSYSLIDVADYMQMNPAYLSRYFKEKTGETFMEYDKKLKMERAGDLLATTNMKTYEIAYQLGYKSVQHFSRIFKEFHGVPPMEYRQRREL